jgi:hypothetical protein
MQLAFRGDILVAGWRDRARLRHTFTLIVILPTNKLLLNPILDKRSVEAERLLTRWGALHAVRTVLSGVAMLIFLYLAIFAKSR